MTTLEDMIRTLERIGVADVILPFILIFTVVYAVLQKSKILGKDAKKFNTMLALVMALASIFPHVTGRGPDVVTIINNALPNVAAVAVAIIMLMFLLGVWGGELKVAGNPLSTWITLFSIGAIIFIFGASAGWGWQVPQSLRFLLNSDTQALIISLLVFGIIVAYITSDGKKGEGEDNMGALARLNKALKDDMYKGNQ